MGISYLSKLYRETIVGTLLRLSDTDDSNFLTIDWNENDTADRTLNFLVSSGNRNVSLAGDFTVEASSLVNQDLTSDAQPVFSAIRLNDTNTTHQLSVVWNENDTANRTLNVLVSGGSRNLTLTGDTTANQDLSTTASPTFVTAKLSGLTDGYIPYHVADATGLANSPIFTNGTNVSIGTAYTTLNFNLVQSNKLGWLDSSGNGKAAIEFNGSDDSLRFYSDTSDLERMRIATGGDVLIGDTVNAKSTQGLTVQQGANDDEILSLKSSDIAHTVTTDTEADTFAYFQKYSATAGGLLVRGLTDTDAAGGLVLEGIIGSTNPTDTNAAVIMIGSKQAGNTTAALGSAETVWQLLNRTTALVTVLGNGRTAFGAHTPTTTIDIRAAAETTFPNNPRNLFICSTDSQAAGMGGGIGFGGVNTGSAITSFAYIGGVKEDGVDGTVAGKLILGVRAEGTGAEDMTRAVITSTGNFGLGTATGFGTSAVKVFSIGSGTAPTTSPADVVQLWVEDVGGAGRAELRVRDELGNVTTLSPHLFRYFEPDDKYYFPWSYYSENTFIGKSINVDMYGAIEAVEKLTGKKFIYTRDIPKTSWDDNQAENEKRRDDQIKAANDRVAELEKRLAELEVKIAVAADNEKAELKKEKAGKVAEKAGVRVPDKYQKRQPPKWIAGRIR